MERTQLIIVKRELELLKTHLLKSNLSEYNKKKLLLELKNAKVVKDEKLPADVVCLDSSVQIMDIENNQKFNFQLVMPSEANMKMNKISVFAPIGIALLGYQEGARVEWEMPNGVKTFQILKVVQKVFEKAMD